MHHERYSDDDLVDFEGFFILLKDLGEDDSLIRQARHLYKDKADKYVKAKREELEPFVDELSKKVIEFLNTLLPVFLARHSELPHSD